MILVHALAFPPTSADGPMARLAAPEQLLAGVALSMGLAASEVTSSERTVSVSIPCVVQQTSAGFSLVPADREGAAIGELHRLSGLTWDQLAQIFDVSRRALHFWASGKTMSASNHEQLQRVLGVVRQVDRGSAAANRALLLTVGADGIVPVDLLRRGEYDRLAQQLGRGRASRVRAPKVAPSVMAARAPRPPAELVAAIDGPSPRRAGKLLAVKPIGDRRK